MQRFNLKLGRLKFSAELKYRITVIDDESGKGKTCLFDAVKKFPGNRAVLTSSLKLQEVDSLNDIENNNEKKIILIDEDCNCLQKNNIKETIKYISNSDDWFVLMTRENKLAQLAYSVDAIYKIVKKSTELTISPKYQKLYTKNSKYPIDTIMIEDSTTGFSFFKKCVENCESFYGKDNYKRCFNIVKYGKLIIFDRMGFGACIKDFYNLLLKHSELQILDYDSFEAFLLEIMDKTIDVEGYSEKELAAFVHDKLSQYGKSSTCSCFEKCKQCESCEFKNFFIDSRKAFKLSKYSDYVIWK